MEFDLTLNETRVLGALIEKQITTPDQYPLSLNALKNACNQKSSRDPVLELSESEVQETVDTLRKKYLVAEKSGFGSRVTKLVHRFGNTEFGALQLSGQEIAVLCVLLLRGPQTPGELRTRTNRMCTFEDVDEVETVLEGLRERGGDAYVVQLAREPGRREARWAHLLSGPPAAGGPRALQTPEVTPAPPPAPDRVARLEQHIEELRAEIDTLKDRLDRLEH